MPSPRVVASAPTGQPRFGLWPKSAVFKLVLLAVTCALLGLSLVRPLYPRDQALQHVPTAIAILLLAIDVRKNWFAPAEFACLIAFLWLHILGARYVYSFVPYDRWAEAIFGASLSEAFGWRRNHYDRVVHFCFGVLFIAPLANIARKSGQLSPSWAIAFGLLGAMTFSALYEVFEWLLTVCLAPEQAEAYNGQQGDMWDAQKDMGLTFCGAVAAAALAVATKSRSAKHKY